MKLWLSAFDDADVYPTMFRRRLEGISNPIRNRFVEN